MIAIIPAAGKSRRFYEAGYKMNKIFLPVEGEKTMLERVIESLGLSEDDELYIVGDVDNQEVYNTIHSKMAKVRGVHWTTVWIRNPIDPLDTVVRIADKVDRSQSLLINFADVWMTESAQALVATVKNVGSCGMTIFNADGDRFDHVMPGVALGGTFYFREADQFFETARTIKRDGREFGPKDVVERLPAHTFYRVALNETMFDLGIPADYESYLQKIYPDTWKDILEGVKK